MAEFSCFQSTIKFQNTKNPESGTISLLVNNSKKIFLKGMGVHAERQITYDISNISSTYSNYLFHPFYYVKDKTICYNKIKCLFRGATTLEPAFLLLLLTNKK